MPKPCCWCRQVQWHKPLTSSVAKYDGIKASILRIIVVPVIKDNDKINYLIVEWSFNRVPGRWRCRLSLVAVSGIQTGRKSGLNIDSNFWRVYRWLWSRIAAPVCNGKEYRAAPVDFIETNARKRTDFPIIRWASKGRCRARKKLFENMLHPCQLRAVDNKRWPAQRVRFLIRTVSNNVQMQMSPRKQNGYRIPDSRFGWCRPPSITLL